MPNCSVVKARSRFLGVRQQGDRYLAEFLVRLRFTVADELPETRSVTLSESVEIDGPTLPEGTAEKAHQKAIVRLTAMVQRLPLISPRLFKDL